MLHSIPEPVDPVSNAPSSTFNTVAKPPPREMIRCETEERMLENPGCPCGCAGTRHEVEGVITTCGRCEYQVQSFGTSSKSYSRNFWLLSEECPEQDEDGLVGGVQHYYVGEPRDHDDDDNLSLNASEVPGNVGFGPAFDLWTGDFVKPPGKSPR